jgi:hypothetical protein
MLADEFETTDRRREPPPFVPLKLYADLTIALRSELELSNHVPHWGDLGSAIEHGLRLSESHPPRTVRSCVRLRVRHEYGSQLISQTSS